MQPTEIEQIRKDFEQAIDKANTSSELEKLRITYLSRNGIITKLFDQLKNISPEEKPAYGKLLNNLRSETRWRKGS